VFCKSRKKFDKYIKINRVRNKVIIDIKEQLDNEGITYDEYRDYFNLLIYTKILHSFKKHKDIYYIPNFENETLDVLDIFRIKNILTEGIKFNLLFFHEEFKDDSKTNDLILSNIDIFDASQVLKDY